MCFWENGGDLVFNVQFHSPFKEVKKKKEKKKNLN